MDCAAEFDSGLISRYEEFGPRYTSYPTAPQFRDDFGEAELRRHAQQSNDEPIPSPLSLYVHLPFCFSPCFYCGCNRIITRDSNKGERYIERLIQEIERISPLFDRDREVVQLHLGGGTPNFMRSEQIEHLLESLRRHFNFSSDPQRDFSIELDPRYVLEADIEALGALGFNRASIGVQDFDPDVQQAVNRVQTVEKTLEVIEACRAHGLASVNVDLIYGLPRQTAAGFGDTLDTIVGVRPDRLAIYGYAHLPQYFKAQRQISEADLPDARARLALLALAVERLTAAGYRYIGMDHFSVPEDGLAQAQAGGTLHRNFMGYTTHADCDLIGLGVSAISHIGTSYSQNPRHLADWERAIDERRLPVWRGISIDFDDRVRAMQIQSLMCHARIDKRAAERRFNIVFDAYFDPELKRLAALADDGLVVVDEDAITATSRGRYLLRIIAACFDRYLLRASPATGQALYSRAL